MISTASTTGVGVAVGVGTGKVSSDEIELI
jgi:hypothetical protein